MAREKPKKVDEECSSPSEQDEGLFGEEASNQLKLIQYSRKMPGQHQGFC